MATPRTSNARLERNMEQVVTHPSPVAADPAAIARGAAERESARRSQRHMQSPPAADVETPSVRIP